jgi:hypothetical protein
MSNTSVFGVYRDTIGLSSGLEALKAAGFRNTDVSVLLPENAGWLVLAPWQFQALGR